MAKTYIYFGHGYEISVTNDKIVPENCTLSTIAEAGIPSLLSSSLNLCNLVDTHKALIKDPASHFTTLKKIFRGDDYGNSFQHKRHLKEGVFHLKTEGKGFKDKNCDFISEFPNGSTKALLRSGLCDIDTPGLVLPKLYQGNIYDSTSINIIHSITIGNIKALYHGSVFPSVEEILIQLEEIDSPDDKVIEYNRFKTEVLKITDEQNVSDLMRRFPGNHYFFPCRSFKKTLQFDYNTLLAERELSKNAENTNELNTLMLPGITLKGTHNFLRYIQKIFIELYVNTGPRRLDKERIILNDTFMIHRLMDYFKDFIKQEGASDELTTAYVNRTIHHLNEGLRLKRFKEDEIDQILLKLIKDSQDFGADPYIYKRHTRVDATRLEDPKIVVPNGRYYFNLKLKEIFITINQNITGNLDDYEILLDNIKRHFSLFISKRMTDNPQVRLFVNTTNKAIREGLENLEFNFDEVDRDLLQSMVRTTDFDGIEPFSNLQTPEYPPQMYFKRTIKYVFIELFKRGYPIPEDDNKLEFLKLIFRLFNAGRAIEIHTEFVNKTIQRINEALDHNEYKEKDIDDELRELIIESQAHGADSYRPGSESHTFNDTLREIWEDKPDIDNHDKRLKFLIILMKRFIRLRGEIEQPGIDRVNRAIRKINGAYASGYYDESAVDKQLIPLLEESKYYGAEPYSGTKTIVDVEL